MDGGLRGGEGLQEARHVAPRRDGRGLPRVPRRHQGPAHDADRRGHPLAERRAAAAPRPLRLPPPGALVRGRPLAGQAPREGEHGDLPREHGGHLRGDRVGGGDRGPEEDRRVPRGGIPQVVPEDPLPGDGGDRPQGSLARGHRAPDRRGDRLRARQQAEEPDDRAQGQHHEVHRGRLPELGLRSRRARLRRPGLHLGGVGADEAREGRGRRERRAESGARVRASSSSRTRSPTSRCSRSSRGRTSST